MNFIRKQYHLHLIFASVECNSTVKTSYRNAWWDFRIICGYTCLSTIEQCYIETFTEHTDTMNFFTLPLLPLNLIRQFNLPFVIFWNNYSYPRLRFPSFLWWISHSSLSITVKQFILLSYRRYDFLKHVILS